MDQRDDLEGLGRIEGAKQMCGESVGVTVKPRVWVLYVAAVTS